MTECPLWPDITVKKNTVPFLPLKFACLLRRSLFATMPSLRAWQPRAFSPTSVTRPVTTWRNRRRVLSKIAYCDLFRNPATCVVLQGASAFALQVWLTSCHEVCFGLLKTGCARAIFYLHLINENASVLRMQQGVFSKLNWARGMCHEEARAASVFARKARAFPGHVCEFSFPYSHTLSFKAQNCSRRLDAQWLWDAKTQLKRLRNAIQTLLNELDNTNNTQSIYIICLLTEFVHTAVFTLKYDDSLSESPSRAWLRECIAVEGILR